MTNPPGSASLSEVCERLFLKGLLDLVVYIFFFKKALEVKRHVNNFLPEEMLMSLKYLYKLLNITGLSQIKKAIR